MIAVLQQPEFCKHCKSPTRGGSEFCCAGCSIAYDLIYGSGLEDFYTKISAPLSPVLDLSNAESKPLPASAAVSDGTYNQIDLMIGNIACSACTWLIEQMPFIYKDIKNVRFNQSTAIAHITFEHSTPIETLISYFRKLGFNAQIPAEDTFAKIYANEKRQSLLRIAIAFASWLGSMHVGLSLLAGILEGMDLHTIKGLGFLSLIISLPALLYSAQSFYTGALLALKSRRLTLDILVSLTLVSGTAISLYNIAVGKNEFYFDAMTMLVAFLLISRFSVRSLEVKLLKKQNSSAQELFPKDTLIEVNDLLEVRSSCSFPCDGVVTEGSSFMNSSWLTGESKPVAIEKNHSVYAGAINVGNTVTIRCTAAGANTRAGKILSLLQNAQKATSIRKSEKYETWLIGIVCLLFLSLAIANIIAPLLSWNTLVALLVISCPCALGVAIPMTFSTALRQAFDRNLLIKGAQVLEDVSEIETVIFDKTGTLTSSQAKLKAAKWDEKAISRLMLATAYLESVLKTFANRFDHPLLSAIRTEYPHVTELESFRCHLITGQGVEGWDGQHHYKIGSRRFASADNNENQTLSELFFSIDGVTVAQFDVESALLPNAKSLISELSKNKTVYILSGDNQMAVQSVAQDLCISSKNVFSAQTPEMKLRFVQEKSKSSNVMMIGDGINDALALKTAHVGIAVSGAAHLALQVTDAYLMNSSLTSIGELLNAAAKVRRVVLHNYLWAIIFNISGAALVLTGQIGPIICAILMPLSSLLVLMYSVSQHYFPTKGSP